MITVDYTQLDYESQARTVSPDNLGQHSSGWFIEGEIHEDWYEWVNHFKAVHPALGVIEGDFEDTITCESQLALDHFLTHVGYDDWDYWDI